MKQLLSKVAFHLLKKQKCNCMNPLKQNIKTAIEKSEFTFFVEFLRKNDYEFECNRILDSIKIENNYIVFANKFFLKKACITCGTCLGWYIDNNSGDFFIGYDIDKYIKDSISNKIKEFDKEKLEKNMAKEICGEEIK